MSSFKNLINAVSGDVFEERPVGIKEFVENDKYLGWMGIELSPLQHKMLEAATEIYPEAQLIELYGEEEGKRRWKNRVTECIFLLGKGCILPSEKVFDPVTGLWKPLIELQDDGYVSGINNLNDPTLEIDKRTPAFKHGVGQCYKVRTSLGHEVKVFGGHKFLTWGKRPGRSANRNQKVPAVWKKLDDMKVGDKIAAPHHLEITNPIRLPDEEVELIGFWLGDGCMPSDKRRVLNMDFNMYEVQAVKRYCEIIEKVSGKPSVAVQHPAKKMTICKTFNNGDVFNVIKKYDLWGKRAHDKEIPKEIYSLPDDQIELFLSRLWGTDGYVYKKISKDSKKITPYAGYTSISKELALGVQRLLLRLGIVSRITSKIPTYTYKGEKKKGQRAYTVSVSGGTWYRKFCERVVLLDKREKQLKLLKPITEYLPNGRKRPLWDMKKGDIYWDKIVEITPIGEHEYWNLTAENTASYVAEGLYHANSGKDLITAIACAYVVYLILCLKEPARTYGKPRSDEFSVVCLATNADQARTVFFAGFSRLIENSPWFVNKYKKKAREIQFDKNITVYSLHSSYEGAEGKNILFAVLDEISAFGVDKNVEANAEDTYLAIKATVNSRFGDVGKLMMLSFSRHKDDFIDNHYNSVIRDKNVRRINHTFVLNDEIPKDTPGNSFDVEYEEDDIISYKFDKIYALRRSTWAVNPTKTIDDFKRQFYENPADALTRFASTSVFSTESFMSADEAIDRACTGQNGVDENWQFRPDFLPEPGVKYYIHADLAQKNDLCVVSMSHVIGFKEAEISPTIKNVMPIVKVDCIRVWTPTKSQTVNMNDVKNFIVSLKNRGFDIALTTFDRYALSHDVMTALKQYGLKTDTLSVGISHFQDLKMVIVQDRLIAPAETDLGKELKQLKLNKKGNVESPLTGHDDTAYSVAGSVFNAASNAKYRREEIDVFIDEEPPAPEPPAPKAPMPEEIKRFLSETKML